MLNTNLDICLILIKIVHCRLSDDQYVFNMLFSHFFVSNQ